LATGRVLQFDQERGYGFVAADDGGEDIFLHASVFDGGPEELMPGTKVEFRVMAGDRGRKAFAAHVINDDSVPVSELVLPPQPVLPPSPVPSPEPVQPAPPAQTVLAPVPPAVGGDDEPDDEPLCDLLSPVDFSQELTELLLSNVPALTGQQILDIRQTVLECARKHGWVEI
jgi:CspA family cold shock protein